MKKIKRSKIISAVSALILAIIMLFVLSSCGVKDDSSPGPGKTDEVPADESTPSEIPATPAPTAVVTRAPTEEPSDPTEEPAPRVKELDPGTDFYLDFTELGESAFTSNGACRIEQEEDGAVMYVVANDPYANVNTETGFGTAEEYRYIAMKLKASKNDYNGEYRFSTTTDGRGWAMIQFDYTKPGEWEVIVLDATTAGYMNPDTLEGDVTSIRIDPYNDGALVLTDEYALKIESIALFTTLEAAQAYKGLYEWPDEAQ